MSEYDQAFIYMPLEQAQLFFGREDSRRRHRGARSTDPDKAADAEAGGQPGRRARGAMVTDWTEREPALLRRAEGRAQRDAPDPDAASWPSRRMNIISGLVMLVKNKSRDIAILRTMGAGQGAILRIFFMAGADHRRAGHRRGPGRWACCSASTSTPIQAFVEWVTGAAVFSADVYFLVPHPGQGRLGRGGGDHRLVAADELPGHPAAGLAGLAPRSGGGASL